MTPLLTLHQVAAGYGGPPLFSEVSLTLHPGQRLCLIGRNGVGKSTLLKILAGERVPEAGQRHLPPRVRVGMVAQVPDLTGYETVRAYVEAGASGDEPVAAWQVDAVLDGLQTDGAAHPGRLSGGEQRRADLARALVARPDVLLLDEPTNHLDLPTIAWLEKHLLGFGGAVVIISHDRAFLRRLCTGMLWLERGELRRRDEGFERFEEWAELVEAELDNARMRLDKKLAQEARWLHRGVTARRSRNMGRLRRLYDLREQRAAMRRQLGTARVQLEAGAASGKVVIKAEGLRKAFGDRTLVDGFSMTILRGDRVGIVGPNGAGKTTLVRMLTGELEPDAGSVRHGTRLTPVYIDQRRSLDGEQTLQQVLCEAGTDQVLVHGQPKHVAGYLQEFLFDGRDMRRPVSTLSGGERARLLFARDFAEPGNLLVLDEPTNDLDLETLDLLQELLGDYEGTLLLVSHDRDFLDHVVTSTVVLDGLGGAEEFAGGWSDAERQGAQAAPSPRAERPATRPSRPRKKARTRLSYKETQERAAVELRVSELHAEIEALEALFSNSEAATADPEGFARATERYGLAQVELESVEERWLELELLAEELGEGE